MKTAAKASQAMLLVAGLLVATQTALAGALESSVQTVSYSTGQSGSKLKWGASRAPVTGPVLQAAATERIPTPEPIPVSDQRSGKDAFADPFADAKPAAQTPAAGKMSDNLLEKSKPTPSLKPAAKGSGSSSKAETELPKLLEPAQVSPSDKAFADQELLAVAPNRRDECADLKTPDPLNREIIRDALNPKGTGVFPQSCPMGKGTFTPRSWQPITFHWTASALCSKPTYFEDVHAERYGHTWGPVLQPFVSAGHFFLVIPALPYAMGLFPPNECVYTLGYYRPGSCAPYYLDPLPLSIRGALFQAGAVTGMAAAIP